jgi:hypothetical protein
MEKALIPFGKYKGEALQSICSIDPEYVVWLISPCPRGQWVNKYPDFAELIERIWQKYDKHHDDEGHQRLISAAISVLVEKDTPKEEVKFASRSREDNWYFSAKSLIIEWAALIGPDAFLVHHFIKSQCPERGLEGPPIIWSEVPSILGITANRIKKSLHTLKSIGLLQTDEEGCLVILDPDDAILSYIENIERRNCLGAK